MPEHGLAVARRLGDVVRRVERDIGTDELFDDVDDAVVAHEAVHEGIADQEVVKEFLRAYAGMFAAEPVDVVGGFGGQVAVNGAAHDGVALLLILAFQRVVHHRLSRVAVTEA